MNNYIFINKKYIKYKNKYKNKINKIIIKKNYFNNIY